MFQLYVRAPGSAITVVFGRIAERFPTYSKSVRQRVESIIRELAATRPPENPAASSPCEFEQRSTTTLQYHLVYVFPGRCGREEGNQPVPEIVIELLTRSGLRRCKIGVMLFPSGALSCPSHSSFK